MYIYIDKRMEALIENRIHRQLWGKIKAFSIRKDIIGKIIFKPDKRTNRLFTFLILLIDR